MTSLVVALLLTVGPAQDKPFGDTDAKRLREKAEYLQRLGKIADDLSAVQTQIRKAKADIEQANVAEQILLDEIVRGDAELHGIRDQIILTETIMGWLRKDDLEKSNSKIQSQIARVKVEWPSNGRPR